jgi:hypothetical protein
MSTIRTPVGPQPPNVYWRRRAVVLLGLVAVIIIILLIVFRPTSEKPTPTASTPKPTAATPSTEDADACDPANIELTAITDKGGYNEGELPLISMSITNTGSTACSINAGTDAQEYIITSGSDQIWSSRDCQTDPVPTETVLQPGIAKSTTPFGWDRTRSSTDTCDGERPQVAAGGASYHLTVKLGDIESAATKQFLLY